MTAIETGEVSYTRTHRATPELLFDCMTQPEHLTHFWGPSGAQTPLDGITVDLRPGGAFETKMVHDDGSVYEMRAVYVEIDRPNRIVFRELDMGLISTITFMDLGDGTTEVTTHQTLVPVEYLGPEAQDGFQSSLDRFDIYIAALAK